MVNAELDFPLLQRHFISRRSKVINISVRKVVRISKECVFMITNNVLTHFVKLFVRISKKSCIENVVVISTIIKTDEFELKQILNVFWGGINQRNTRTITDRKDNNKQIGKYFAVNEDQIIVRNINLHFERKWLDGF